MFSSNTTNSKDKPSLKSKSEGNQDKDKDKDKTKEQTKKQTPKEVPFKLNNRDVGNANLRAVAAHFVELANKGDKDVAEKFVKWHKTLPNPPGKGSHGENQPLFKERRESSKTQEKSGSAAPARKSL